MPFCSRSGRPRVRFLAHISLPDYYLFTDRCHKALYDICKNNQHIVQARVHRSCLQLGDTVQVTLDFVRSQLPCYQISAWLECVETVSGELAGLGGVNIGGGNGEGKRPEFRRKVAEWYNWVLGTERALLSLAIPNSQAPEFSTTFCMRVFFACCWELCSYILRSQRVVAAAAGVHYGR